MNIPLISCFSLATLLAGTVTASAQADVPTQIEDLYQSELAPFYHGVASGDPLADGFIIWTRVTLPENQSRRRGRVPVQWEVASDPCMKRIVRSGIAFTSDESDYTVKVDVRRLPAGKTFYYRFQALGKSSIVGKTKTAPKKGVEQLKFAVISCSNYEWGYFSGYDQIAKRTDLDAVIHLGDYLYEYEDNASYSSPVIRDERVLFPAHETITLDDYRTRYATYRLDPNLRRAHQQHPFIAVWDDHESANDSWTGGAENHDPTTEGDWELRKAAAKKAYFEWMPIRGNGTGVSRSLSYGPLMDLVMIDTRLEGRDEQINDVTDPALYAPDRTILGQSQKAWLKSELENSAAQWKVIGNQVIFSEFNIGFAAALDPSTTPQALESLFLDIWDGYPAERNELVNFIGSNGIDNVVFLTGDFHSSFAFEVADPAFGNPYYDPSTGAGAVAIEFATPSISAANFDENLDPGTSDLLEYYINNPIDTPYGPLNFNPHMKYVDLDQHGYFVLSVKQDSVQADYYYLADILVPETTETWGAGLISAAGSHHLVQAAAPAAPKAVQDIPAPEVPCRRPRWWKKNDCR